MNSTTRIDRLLDQSQQQEGSVGEVVEQEQGQQESTGVQGQGESNTDNTIPPVIRGEVLRGEATRSYSTSNNSSSSHQQQYHHHSSRRSRNLSRTLSFVALVLQLIMNAAVTIFGMGIGVGLILGDSVRGRSTTTTATTTTTTTTTGTNTTTSGTSTNDYSNTTSTTNNNNANDDGEDVLVHGPTPSCRATVRRITRNQVQEAPQLSLSATSRMPAQ